jgi:CxxC motif-containing protein
MICLNSPSDEIIKINLDILYVKQQTCRRSLRWSNLSQTTSQDQHDRCWYA